MSQAGPSRAIKSFKAAATVSAYHVVANDTVTAGDFAAIRVIHIWSETAQILGIAQDYADTTSGQFQAVPVVSFGYSRMAAGASVSAGAILTFVTTTGYAIESAYTGSFNTGSTAFNTSGSKIPKTLGIALNKASLTDAVFEAFLQISNINVRVA